MLKTNPRLQRGIGIGLVILGLAGLAFSSYAFSNIREGRIGPSNASAGSTRPKPLPLQATSRLSEKNAAIAKPSAGLAAAQPTGSNSNSRAPGSPALGAAAAVSGGPGAARPASSSRPVRSFSFDYTFDPPGRREWTQHDSLTWVQRLPTGQEELFKAVGATTVAEVQGTIVRPANEHASYEVFIPNRNSRQRFGRWMRFRTGQGSAWEFLGEIAENTNRAP